MARGWYKMKISTAKAKTAEILIYDEIGKSWWGEDTVSAKQFVDDLQAIGEVDNIDLRINSPGGDVFDGIAIHNAVKNHKAKVTAYIDGIAASAASFIAMAADSIIMPSNAFMLVHGASGMSFGNAEDMRKMAEDLERINASLTSTYAARTGKTAAKVEALMAEDRLIDAAECLDFGLCDEMTEPVKMAANYSLKLLPKSAAETITAAIEKDPEKAPPPASTSEGAGDETGSDPASSTIEPPAGDQPQAKGATVVELDAARNEGARNYEKYVNDVSDLCILAGAPEKAAAFIKAKTKVDDVRASLIRNRAEGGREVNSHNKGNPSLGAPAAAWKNVADKLNAGR